MKNTENVCYFSHVYKVTDFIFKIADWEHWKQRIYARKPLFSLHLPFAAVNFIFTLWIRLYCSYTIYKVTELEWNTSWILYFLAFLLYIRITQFVFCTYHTYHYNAYRYPIPDVQRKNLTVKNPQNCLHVTKSIVRQVLRGSFSNTK